VADATAAAAAAASFNHLCVGGNSPSVAHHAAAFDQLAGRK